MILIRALVPRGLEDEPDPLASVAAAIAIARPAGARVEAVVVDAQDAAAARELGADSVAPVSTFDALQALPRPLLTLLPAGAGDLCARLAMRLDGAALGRCESIELAGDHVVARRPAFGGKVRVAVRAGANAFATMRMPRTVFASPPRAAKGEMPLTGAPVVVSGGRGMGGPEGFALLRELAELLGGAVGGSLPTVDAGWVPVARQVGQSGRYVEPQVYVAFGISGTPQHLAGVGPATRIVAVNTDAGADIFRVAEAGLVGDWREILPALLEKLRAP